MCKRDESRCKFMSAELCTQRLIFTLPMARPELAPVHKWNSHVAVLVPC